jgi:hypothetical protein
MCLGWLDDLGGEGMQTRHIFRQEKYVKSKCGKKKAPLNPRSGCAFPYFSRQLRCIRHTHVDKRLKEKTWSGIYTEATRSLSSGMQICLPCLSPLGRKD